MLPVLASQQKEQNPDGLHHLLAELRKNRTMLGMVLAGCIHIFKLSGLGQQTQ